MASRTDSLSHELGRQAQTSVDKRLAALHNGSLVAIFDSSVDAVVAAGQLLSSNPAAPVWVAVGRRAAEDIIAARERRSPLSKLAAALGDEQPYVDRIVGYANEDKTVFVTRADDGSRRPAGFDSASHLIELGSWTLRDLR